jgi:hypothetical protein
MSRKALMRAFVSRGNVTCWFSTALPMFQDVPKRTNRASLDWQVANCGAGWQQALLAVV